MGQVGPWCVRLCSAQTSHRQAWPQGMRATCTLRSSHTRHVERSCRSSRSFCSWRALVDASMARMRSSPACRCSAPNSCRITTWSRCSSAAAPCSAPSSRCIRCSAASNSARRASAPCRRAASCASGVARAWAWLGAELLRTTCVMDDWWWVAAGPEMSGWRAMAGSIGQRPEASEEGEGLERPTAASPPRPGPGAIEYEKWPALG
mmetsp:Transcript_25412/g.81906  ORF Transcript_25412/g.81906 Transcript_25412/m.81906 type:complete len:206 (-) Transcript_25412:26-643(-)